MADPDPYEVIAGVKDIHSAQSGRPCPQDGQPHPCNTYRFVDAFVAARFEADGRFPEPADFMTACTQVHEHDPVGCAPEV